MQFIVNSIIEHIAEKEPAPGNETIILINGFDRLIIYAEIAKRLNSRYSDRSISINIKLAKRKWEELSKKSNDLLVQQVEQSGLVADKESVTYYRNLHNVDILILLGTENEEDTGGLINCFTITPDWLINNLEGQYDLIFENCFVSGLSDDDRRYINAAYKALFEYCPVDICRLSDTADRWNNQFDSINDFSAEFGKTLPEWGFPGRIEKPFKPQNFHTKTNFLRNEKDYISGKMFQRMSQKAYKSFVSKMSKYAEEGHYSGSDTDWTQYGFDGFEDFSNVLLEFARGENVTDNRLRLLKVDFSIINDILKFKTPGPIIDQIKTTEISITGEPLIVIMRSVLYTLKKAREASLSELHSISFSFTSANIITGYTDVDDEDKIMLLYEAWKNICTHVNGIFDFINQNAWNFYDDQIVIVCETPDFFDPQKVTSQIENTVGVATGTNTLNKINFSINLLDRNGNILQREVEGKLQEISYSFVWKFDNEASWLYDFKDLVVNEDICAPSASRIPLGTMQKIKNMMVIKSEEEFFDLYDEDSLDLSFDLNAYIGDRLADSDNYELKQLTLLFSDLGKVFCSFIRKVSFAGLYSALCEGNFITLNERYMKVADKILSVKFDENKQWIKDVFLQAFVILDSKKYISEEMEPECVIIPPWHPAALQKIAAQKRFILDGLSQKVSEYNEDKITLNVDNIIDHFTRMTEIQSSIDLFPANGNDYMGVLGTYGHFCVYGNEKSVSTIRTRIKDVIRKEAIYDEEFKTSELTKMNDDARMIYDILTDYNKAMPSVKCNLSIVFINPPDLQPIISAISKYTKEIHSADSEALIDLKLGIFVRPENKGGKNYLTYWMDDYFSEEANTSVRIYLNEWSKKNELEKLLSNNNDIVFNMDLLHAETFRFIPDPGETGGKVSDCRFPIVYKPSPLSITSKKRKIEITQTQFSASFKHTQVARYKKNPEIIPAGTFLAVRETSVEKETKQIIDMLHKKAYWVVCIDKVMDGALLRTDRNADNSYAIIGFSTGKGMYGQYNLTITARNSILETVQKKLKNRLYRLFKWDNDILEKAVKNVMDESRSLDGISMLSAINQNGTNINEFMAYVMTSLRENLLHEDAALKVIIHLDSYKHWFDNSATNDISMRPDFLMLSVIPSEGFVKLKATVIECKTASINNYNVHIDKAKKQVKHGLAQLQKLFDPNTHSIERRYWYAQLYRALVFAQVTFSNSSTEFEELSRKLRAILDGDFEIEWEGKVLGYWIDKAGNEESMIEEDGISICNIPQEHIQNILIGSDASRYVTIEEDVLDEIEDDSEEKIEEEVNKELKKKRNEIISRKKPSTSELIKDYFPATEKTSAFDTTNNSILAQSNSDSTSVSDINDAAFIGPNDKIDISSGSHIESRKIVSESSVEDAMHSDNETVQNQMRVLIGRDRTGHDVYWEYGHRGLSNRHLLITGTSGQGKTYGIQSMLYEISKSDVSMVVFDYTEGFRTDQLERKFLDKMEGRIDNRVVYFTGVPINPFKRHEIEVAGMKAPEKISDVAQRIASTLTHVYTFGDQQFAAIYDACYTGLSKYGDAMSMKHLESELNASVNKAAKSVVSKMTPFLHSVDFSNEHCNWNDILYNQTGKLTIFQLTSFVREIQVIITEFMLWDMWHYTKKNGSKDKPFVVVLDEAQNLSHADNSPSGLILTEGRKFGWSAWYATQSLKVLNDDEITRLMQAAFKLYFKPTAGEIISMAKQLNPSDANYWRQPLTNLKKGECIVVGDRIQNNGEFKPGKPTVTKVTSFEDRQ